MPVLERTYGVGIVRNSRGSFGSYGSMIFVDHGRFGIPH